MSLQQKKYTWKRAIVPHVFGCKGKVCLFSMQLWSLRWQWSTAVWASQSCGTNPGDFVFLVGWFLVVYLFVGWLFVGLFVFVFVFQFPFDVCYGGLFQKSAFPSANPAIPGESHRRGCYDVIVTTYDHAFGCYQCKKQKHCKKSCQIFFGITKSIYKLLGEASKRDEEELPEFPGFVDSVG